MFLFTFVVIALASAVNSQSIIDDGLPSEVRNKLNKFSIIYIQKCGKNLDPNKGADLEKALTSVSSCVSLKSNSALTVNDFCNNYGKQFVSCLRSFADAGKGCLDANEKYLPDFILNGQTRVLDKYCKGNAADHITKISNSKCKKPLAQALNSDFVENCVPKLKLIQNLDKENYSMNKADVCSDLKASQECVVNSIKTNCEVAKDDLDFLNSIFQEYQTDCNFAKTNIASFFLLTALMTILKLFR